MIEIIQYLRWRGRQRKLKNSFNPWRKFTFVLATSQTIAPTCRWGKSGQQRAMHRWRAGWLETITRQCHRK